MTTTFIADDNGLISGEPYEEQGANLANMGKPELTEAQNARALGKRKAAYKRQEQWLSTFAKTNSESGACAAAGVSLRTLDHWKSEDYLGFAERWADAKRTFVDTIEAHLAHLALNTKPGQNPAAVFGVLNAERPDKYRMNVHATDDTAKTLMQKLRSMDGNKVRDDGDGGTKSDD